MEYIAIRTVVYTSFPYLLSRKSFDDSITKASHCSKVHKASSRNNDALAKGWQVIEISSKSGENRTALSLITQTITEETGQVHVRRDKTNLLMTTNDRLAVYVLVSITMSIATRCRQV